MHSTGLCYCQTRPTHLAALHACCHSSKQHSIVMQLHAGPEHCVLLSLTCIEAVVWGPLQRVPQHDCHRRRGRAGPALRHEVPDLVGRRHRDVPVLDHLPVHPVAGAQLHPVSDTPALGMPVQWPCAPMPVWCLQLCAMHELDGHRFCRYHELGQYVFGAPCCSRRAKCLPCRIAHA